MDNPNNMTVPMAFDDGSQAYVPQEKVQDAVRDGGKLVQSMTFDDGSKAWVPLDRVHEAIHGGGQLVPPPMPKPPQPAMQESALGHLYAGEDPNADARAQAIQAHPWLKPVDAVGSAFREAEVAPTIGAAKSAAQTVIGAANLPGRAARAVGVNVPEIPTPPFLETKGPGETVGAVGENILEFILGEGALKSLSASEKLSQMAKLSKTLDKFPRLKTAAQIGAQALRQGFVGGAQALTHGADIADSAKAGALTAGAGLAAEGLAGAVRNIAPAVREIAGANIPVRASQESALANAAENIAPTKALQKFDIQQTQPAARKAIGNIASEVASEDISGQTLPKVARDLGERAEQIEAQSKPVFEKLDELTKGDKLTFSDLQAQAKAARRAGDIELAKEATAKQEEILNRFKDQFDPTDLQHAKMNWAQAAALDDVHQAIGVAPVVPTPVAFRVTGAPDPGYINPKAFSKQVLRLSKNGTLARAGLIPEHIQALQDLGTLLEKSADVHKLPFAVKIIGEVAGGVPAGSGFMVSHALGGLLTNPALTMKTNAALTQLVAPAMSAAAVKHHKITHVYRPETGDIEPIE